MGCGQSAEAAAAFSNRGSIASLVSSLRSQSPRLVKSPGTWVTSHRAW